MRKAHEMRFIASTILQLVGLTAAAVGVGLVYVPAGFIAAGAALVVVGYAAGVDPSAKGDA